MSKDEAFFAWLDGELGKEEAAAMEKRVAADPRLARLAAEHRGLQQRLGAAFGPILDEAVPERLSPTSANDRFTVVDFTSAPRKRFRFFALMQSFALAAALALGIFIGGAWRPTLSPVQQYAGKLYAAASLQHSLDSDLASEPRPGTVRVGITFHDQSGAICRSFTDEHSTGVACREGGRWRLDGLFGNAGMPTGDYRMAGGIDPRLADLIGSMMAGEPLNAQQERAAKQRNWR